MAGVQRSGIDRCVMRVLKGQKMKLKYRRNGYRYAHDLPGEWEADDDLEEMAESAAQDYWSNHDGFEARWPLTFEILLPDGGMIGSAAVEMDTEPVFTAKPPNAK